MKKIHLMHQKNGDIWYIIDTEKDGFGAAHNGLVSILHTEDVMQADSLTDLLTQIYDNKDRRFYIVVDTIYHDGSDQYEKYPDHMSLDPICGYMRDIFTGRDNGHGISYVSELWIREDETLRKIRNFNMKEKMKGEKDE